MRHSNPQTIYPATTRLNGKPPDDRLRINVDGSWTESMKLGGGWVGIVIREDDGSFIAARMKRFSYVSSPLHIEALAAREGLLLAAERGFLNFSLESDSLLIVKALNLSTPDLSHVGPVVGETRDLLFKITGAFASQANEAAHCVAHNALISSIKFLGLKNL